MAAILHNNPKTLLRDPSTGVRSKDSSSQLLSGITIRKNTRPPEGPPVLDSILPKHEWLFTDLVINAAQPILYRYTLRHSSRSHKEQGQCPRTARLLHPVRNPLSVTFLRRVGSYVICRSSRTTSLCLERGSDMPMQYINWCKGCIRSLSLIPYYFHQMSGIIMSNMKSIISLRGRGFKTI
ncbi:unnamed protein product [Nezara viridula]|uniref:Uncharacterized protein n=1 Tax=Nezara viridula TaxID=85310 RepID=A0A9P0HAU8_NEZVI|nr:unnamed protein product [Nezara viridula]